MTSTPLASIYARRAAHSATMLLSASLVPLKGFGDERDAGRAQWPATRAVPVERVLEDLAEEDRETIRATPRHELIRCHHSWGTGIGNEFGLWQGKESLARSCLERRETTQWHPDEVSMIMIERIWAALRAVRN